MLLCMKYNTKECGYTINYEDTQITYHYKLLPIAAFIPDGPSKPRELRDIEHISGIL